MLGRRKNLETLFDGGLVLEPFPCIDEVYEHFCAMAEPGARELE